MTIEQVLDVSTVHVPENFDLATLDFTLATGLGGTYIYVPESHTIGEIPDWLDAIFNFAFYVWDAGYIRVTDDGTIYEELKRFDLT